MPALLAEQAGHAISDERQSNEKPGTPRVVAPGLDLVFALDYGSDRS